VSTYLRLLSFSIEINSLESFQILMLKSKKLNKTYFSFRRGQEHQARGDLVQRRSRPERSSRRCPRFRSVLGYQPVSVTRQTSLPQTGNDPCTLDPCRRYVQAGKFACK
jgi:hypothetical protein